MFKFIPPFMRNANYAILGAGALGTVVYTVAKQRVDIKLSHPLVKESILLLQNNDDIVQLIGVPIVIEPTIGSRASVSEDVSNFSFKVRGPRGKLSVEIAGVSAPLKDLGVGATGREQIKREIENKTGKFSEMPPNTEVYNFNEFYIPDSSIVQDYFQLSQKLSEEESGHSLQPSDRFWKYEYLYAEVDKESRILVSPNERLAKEQQPVLFRGSVADLKQEYKDRLKTYRVMDSNMTGEEKEEFRKIRYQEYYRRIGYTRTYFMVAMCLAGMQAYILFRKNKRLPIVQNSLHQNIQNFLVKTPEFKNAVGGSKVYFIDQSLGSLIGNFARYSFQFMGSRSAGVVHFEGTFDEETGMWKVEQLDVEVYEDENSKKSTFFKMPTSTYI